MPNETQTPLDSKQEQMTAERKKAEASAEKEAKKRTSFLSGLFKGRFGTKKPEDPMAVLQEQALLENEQFDEELKNLVDDGFEQMIDANSKLKPTNREEIARATKLVESFDISKIEGQKEKFEALFKLAEAVRVITRALEVFKKIDTTISNPDEMDTTYFSDEEIYLSPFASALTQFNRASHDIFSYDQLIRDPNASSMYLIDQKKAEASYQSAKKEITALKADMQRRRDELDGHIMLYSTRKTAAEIKSARLFDQMSDDMKDLLKEEMATKIMDFALKDDKIKAKLRDAIRIETGRIPDEQTLHQQVEFAFRRKFDAFDGNLMMGLYSASMDLGKLAQPEKRQ